MNSIIARIDKIIEHVPERRWYVPLTPFERLVSTILSQNTSREATVQGFENLRKRFQVVPAVLADAEVEEIKDCIKPSGLYNIKAPRIKQLARIILEEYGGDLNYFANLPLDVARERLLQIPGVGYKTADVFLSIVCGRESFAVDTHIARIAKRWQMVADNAGYEHIRLAYEAVIPPEKRQAAHLCLIEFGRQICRARRPRCDMCPVYGECEWAAKSEHKGLA
ncbi:MAG: endonuclease III [Deltaproteobacteria bacterium]|nr:MAG: endonuclease III [Deltaproteobacteria bacterium]UCH06792.1 MAG: endonuclease III [Deltaproteobacteria bacterium]